MYHRVNNALPRDWVGCCVGGVCGRLLLSDAPRSSRYTVVVIVVDKSGYKQINK